MSDGPGSARQISFRVLTAHSTVTGTGKKCPYFELLPDLCKMSVPYTVSMIFYFTIPATYLPTSLRRCTLNHRLSPLARPLIAEAAGAHRKELRAKIPISPGLRYSLCKWEPGGKAFKGHHYLHGIVVH